MSEDITAASIKTETLEILPTPTTSLSNKRRKRKSVRSLLDFRHHDRPTAAAAKVSKYELASADDVDFPTVPLIPANFCVPPSLSTAFGETSATDQPSADDNAEALHVTCGYSSGLLRMEKFFCPGIHQLCIEFESRLISPKQFTIISGKDKQKDWKAAIKYNQQSMRTLFEKGKIDFYKHVEFCSGRCVSKVIKPIATTPELEDSSVLIGQNDDVMKKQLNSGHRQKASASTSSSSGSETGVFYPLLPEIGDSTIFSDPDTFWTAVYQLGIFYELTQEIDEQLNVLRTCFKLPEMKSKAAHKLSELVKVLDLKEKIQLRLLTKRSLTKAQSVVVENELTELKKIAESQEKKHREIKRKSDILDQLILQAAVASAARGIDLSATNRLLSR